MHHIITALIASIALGATVVSAEIKTEKIGYRDGDVELEGYLAYDDAVTGTRPGVLVVHEWWGLNGYARKRARMLAKLGYVAFACDMYGKGKVTNAPGQAGEWSGALYRDMAKLRGRVNRGLDVLRQHDRVDADRLGAIGYCFGGTTVLQLAYSGAPVEAVVSFHGNPRAASSADVPRIKAELLICNGAADSHVKPEAVAAFRKALAGSDVRWTWIDYAHAVHSFTNPGADARGMDSVGYNARADHRSWGHMRVLFRDVFGE